jgi:hypothetical protein
LHTLCGLTSNESVGTKAESDLSESVLHLDDFDGLEEKVIEDDNAL